MIKENVITLGCRLNAFESEAMRAELSRIGDDNSIIINSCAVTAEAVRQTRQTIRKIRKLNPKARLIVTGCAAELAPDDFAAMEEVDQVIGNLQKLKRDIFTPSLSEDSPRIIHDDIMKAAPDQIEAPILKDFGNRARVFLQVQTGCDHRCTFCIIPFARGASRSVPAGKMVEQVQHLVENGTKEIVLCGVDMTAYGRDLPISGGLGTLVGQILKLVPNLQRLRLSSLDCSELDEELIALIIKEERIMPHLHLSLQAGDAMILKRMKRRHSPKQAVDLATRLRQNRNGLVFGADLIAGFPTESDEMFENSVKHIDEVGLTWLHVFPFSARQGTPAARIPSQIPKEIRKQRAAILRAKGEANAKTYMQSLIGTCEHLLLEKGGTGYTKGYAPFKLVAEDNNHLDIHNQFLQATFIGIENNHLLAKAILNK